jgi:predicted nucleotidyltransferase
MTGSTMIDKEDIVALAERIAREFAPERIILFGSYAYGTPTEDSDVDLLVVPCPSSMIIIGFAAL